MCSSYPILIAAAEKIKMGNFHQGNPQLSKYHHWNKINLCMKYTTVQSSYNKIYHDTIEKFNY